MCACARPQHLCRRHVQYLPHLAYKACGRVVGLEWLQCEQGQMAGRGSGQGGCTIVARQASRSTPPSRRMKVYDNAYVWGSAMISAHGSRSYMNPPALATYCMQSCSHRGQGDLSSPPHQQTGRCAGCRNSHYQRKPTATCPNGHSLTAVLIGKARSGHACSTRRRPPWPMPMPTQNAANQSQVRRDPLPPPQQVVTALWCRRHCGASLAGTA